MRYRKEDDSGDYTFGQGDNTFLTDTPEAVAQAVKTRFELWTGEWFLDVTEGTPYKESILGKHKSSAYSGGASYFGGGGRSGAGAGAGGGGVSGSAPGTGGGGAYDPAYSGLAGRGGNGAAGIVIIEEFS